MVTTSPTPTKGRKAKAPEATAPVETPAADAAASTITIANTEGPQPVETAVAQTAQPEPETAPIVVEGASSAEGGPVPDLAPAAETGETPETEAAPVSGVELSQPKRLMLDGFSSTGRLKLAKVAVDGQWVDVLAAVNGSGTTVVIVTADGRKYSINPDDLTATDATTGEVLEVV